MIFTPGSLAASIPEYWLALKFFSSKDKSVSFSEWMRAKSGNLAKIQPEKIFSSSCHPSIKVAGLLGWRERVAASFFHLK